MPEPVRIKGKLRKFHPKQGSAHGLVELSSGEVLHVPAVNRGILEPNKTIRPCVNGERYQRISAGTVIELDVVYNDKGQSPFPIAWAPSAK